MLIGACIYTNYGVVDMNTSITINRKVKRTVVFISVSSILLFITAILVLMLYPLYGYLFKTSDSIYYSHTITVDGVEIEYMWLESIKNDGLLSFFNKGELYEVTDEYNIYRWKIAPNSNVEYLLFEPTKEKKYDPDLFSWYRHSMDRLEICRMVTDN